MSALAGCGHRHRFQRLELGSTLDQRLLRSLADQVEASRLRSSAR
jgi:hypothetical protein